MSDISMDDAPVEMDNEEASAWAQGYNAAIAAKDAENKRLRAEVSDMKDHLHETTLQWEQSKVDYYVLRYKLWEAVELMKVVHDRDAAMLVFHLDLSAFIDDYLAEHKEGT